jgi:uncharacterized protein (TIGR00251 family)
LVTTQSTFSWQQFVAEKLLQFRQAPALWCAGVNAMRIRVKVTPRAKRPGIEAAADGTLVVKVREPADDGRANVAVVAALAKHFSVPRRAVSIVHGHTNRRKLVEIAE